MMDIVDFNLVLFATALGFSAVASYFDLKTGEIPDKFTMGLVVVALAMRAIFSAFLGDVTYLLDGLLVGGIFFCFGAFLFYTGGWGGGDAKLIAGVGAALGGYLAPSLVSSIPLLPEFFGFFVALSIAAIPYSLGYAFILSLKHPKVFSETKKMIIKNWIIFVVLVALSITLAIIVKVPTAMLTILFIMPPIFYLLTLFTKNVEKIAMQKEIPVSKLVEGDMVVEDVFLGKTKVASKRDMDGLSKEALEKIQKSKQAPKTVRIKWGIRFAPAFPIALLLAPYWTLILPALI